MNRPIKISVIGAGDAAHDECRIAYEVGSLIAERGCVLITGGLGGVMEAASKGAAKKGGIVIGILPSLDPNSANKFVNIPLPTGLGEGRNLLVARSSDGVIAIGGKLGTLSEIAFALKSGKPVVGVGTWELDSARVEPCSGIIKASSADEAVHLLLSKISPNF